jgi:hypothetical protein
MKKVVTLLVSVAALSYGCSKDYEPDPKEKGYEYYPLNIGDFRVYNVHEVRYQDKDSTVTDYQLRERVDTTYTNQAGELTYKIIRSKRTNAAQGWLDDSVLVVNRSATDLRTTANNVKKVQLIFPVRNFKNWNPNAFNTLDSADSHYANKGAAFTVKGNQYANTVRVVEADISNILRLENRYEIYAENVGMVYKKEHVINFCNDPEVCGVVDGTVIINGIRRIKELETYGNE